MISNRRIQCSSAVLSLTLAIAVMFSTALSGWGPWRKYMLIRSVRGVSSWKSSKR
ncbi:hypothetical protein [Paenibacillus sp. JCM 10914]|uniref:hypothetical protein n=1 Tax=Paenibacillus sp. JCM 10914 TaxID=1236974 RepID=UPI001E2E674B|nr:hypothetical protein [Paenibacillus sp. JCM 10914]